MQTVISWLLSFMVTISPPDRKIWYPEGQETVEEANARYTSIANDVMDVVYDENERPLFKGADGRSKTAAVVLAVMYHESQFMKHVDFGLGKYARGDHGRSWCMMQINIGAGKTKNWNVVKDRPAWPKDPPNEITAGHSGEELVKDRKLCIREGLKIIRSSFSECRSLPIDERLRSFASGSCDKGAQSSENRMHTAMRWFGRSAPKRGFLDVNAVAFVTEEKKKASTQLGNTPTPGVASQK